MAPLTPANAPNNPPAATITPNRSVHWRAAAAGATIMALISTTPTACKPMTMATTSSVSAKSPANAWEAQTGAKIGVKTEQFELFPKERHEQQRRAAKNRHHNHIPLEQGGGLPKQEGVQAGLPGVGVALQKGEQHQPKAKKDGKDDAQGAVFFDAGVAGNADHKQGG
jgi:hypothetical protein